MTGKPLALDAIANIPDPTERAREAARLDVYARATAEKARAVRDAATRDAYAAGGITRGALAEQIGVTESVVVTALRDRKAIGPC